MSARRRISRLSKQYPLPVLLILALLPRLLNIGSNIIGVHSWRQADTAAMARNFYTAPFSLTQFLYPAVDWGGGGYAETEFPLYPALVSLLYRLLGLNEAYARGLSVLFSLLGLYFLYRLVTLCFSQAVAFWSALFYAILPLSIFYGRTVQPESLVTASCLGSLYFFKRWLVALEQEANGSKHYALLFGSWVLAAIAILLKVLPFVYLGWPLLYLAIVKFRGKLFLRADLWLYALSLFAVTAAWYVHAHSIFLETRLTFGFWSGDTDRYTWSSLLSGKYWLDIIFRVMVRHFAVFGFFVALVGLSIPRQQAEDWMWEVGLLGSFAAGAIAPTSSYVHEYYQLPVMFFGVVFIGKVFARSNRSINQSIDRSVNHSVNRSTNHQIEEKPPIKPRRRLALTALLILTLLTSTAIYTIDYLWEEDPLASEVHYLATIVNKYVPPDAKVLTTTGGDPTALYLANRKGWMISPEEVSPDRLEAAIADGANYFVGSYEIVQNYADFTDDSQKENIRQLLQTTPPALVNDTRTFVTRLAPAATTAP